MGVLALPFVPMGAFGAMGEPVSNLIRIKTWGRGLTITMADLNDEFDNIFRNADELKEAVQEHKEWYASKVFKEARVYWSEGCPLREAAVKEPHGPNGGGS